MSRKLVAPLLFAELGFGFSQIGSGDARPRGPSSAEVKTVGSSPICSAVKPERPAKPSGTWRRSPSKSSWTLARIRPAVASAGIPATLSGARNRACSIRVVFSKPGRPKTGFVLASWRSPTRGQLV